MAAMVAPVGVEDAEFRFGGIAAFLAEMQQHFPQVVGVHGQAPVLAEDGQVFLLHREETVEGGQRPHGGVFAAGIDRQVLFPRLHGVDEVPADGFQAFGREIVVEHEQAAAVDLHGGGRIDQVDAVEGRGGALVELAGDVFHGQEAAPGEVERVGHGIGHAFAEDRVTALLKQVIAESRQVVEVDQPE